MASELEEVEGLDRVLTRLALTDEDKLEKVLHKLIPVVVGSLKSPHAKTRAKVMEILSHVNKRVKNVRGLKLPLEALVDMFVDPVAAPMVRNFALVYAEMAVERAAPEESLAAAPKLLQGISRRPPQHAAMCLRMALAGLVHLPQPHTYRAAPTPEVLERFPMLQSKEDTAVVLQYLLKVLQYLPASKASQAAAPPQAALPLAPPAAAPGAGDVPMAPAAAGPPPPTAPPGLSMADVKVLEEKLPSDPDVVAKRKLGALSFLAAAAPPPADVLPHFLVASCDPSDQVSSRGDDLARRHCGIDSAKPAVDLEDASLVARLMALFHGTTRLEAGVSPEAQVQPAGPSLRVKLVGLFVKSVAAANCFPHSLMAVEECLYGGGTNARLRGVGMELAVWVLKHAAQHQLKAMGGAMLEGLLRALDEAATTENTATQMLRGFAYQAVGQLAKRLPEALSGRLDVAERLFSALSTEPSGVKAAVQEGTNALAEAFRGATGEQAAAVEALLLRSIAHHKDTVRLCAVQWAVKLFPFAHVPARYICILGAGDAKLEVAAASRQGLRQGPGAEAASEEEAGGAGKGAGVQYPPLKEMLAYLRANIPKLRTPATAAASLPLPAGAFLALIAFLRSCQSPASPSAPPSPSRPPAAAPPSDVDMADAPPAAASDPLKTPPSTQYCTPPAVSYAAADPAPEDLEGVLPPAYTTLVENALARDASSEVWVAALQALVAASYQHFSLMAHRCTTRLGLLRPYLAALSPDSRLAAAKLVACALSAMPESDAETLLQQVAAVARSTDDRTHKWEERDGSLLASGYMLAQCLSGSPKLPPAALQDAASALVAALLQTKDPHLAATAALSLGHASLRGALPLEQAPADLPGVVARVVALLEEKDVKVAARGVQAAGYLAAACPSTEVLEPLLTGLFKLATSKAEELQFGVGEALALAFAGCPVPVPRILHSNFTSLAAQFNIYRAAPGDGGSGMEVDSGEGAGAPGEGGAEGEARVAAQARILDHTMKELAVHSRLEARCAATVWLVSLLTYCRRHPRVLALLPELQGVLTPLLGDPNELTQEMAARGVSLAYSLGGQDTQKGLVEGLVAVLQGAGRGALAAGKVTGDTRVLEEGASGSGGLSTYKELCSLATDIGQPELIYRFMDLAHHQAALTSRRGAAFGVAGIAKLAGEQLAPHLAALVPKLYRYQFDPNPRVQDAMVHIWRALVDDSKATVNKHYGAIMTEVIKEAGGRLWRNRQASCAALAELLQGRGWAEVGAYMGQAWTMALRAMDDIKESVRTAGASLARTLRALTLRLVDTTYTSPVDAKAAVEVALPLLLDQGVHSGVPEVRGVAITTLSKAVRAAGPELVRPHLTPLVAALLESLSSLEDSRLNYIEQHAARLGLDSDKLEGSRVAASRSSPMWETLELAARYADTASLDALVPELCNLVRRGVGINTRAGTARFIALLASRLAADIRPHCPALVKALTGAVRSERSVAARRGLAAANAEVLRFAAPKRVERVVQEALASYNEGGSDAEARKVGGLLLRELLRVAPDSFQEHAGAILPAAFAAKMDEDAEVAAVWGEVWEEGASSEGAAVRLYMGELVEMVAEWLAAQQWGRKRAAAQALGALAELGRDSLAPHAGRLAAALLAEAGGRLWEGKEALLEALGQLCKACPDSLRQAPGSAAVLDAVLAAAARKKAGYRAAALACLQVALAAFQEDHYARVAPPLLDACAQHAKPPPSPRPGASSSAPAATSSSDPPEGDDAPPAPLPLVESLKCLAAAWTHAAPQTVTSRGAALAATLAATLASHPPWAAILEALEASRCLTKVLEAQAGAVPAKQAAEWLGPLVQGAAVALTDAKVQQVRTAALQAVQGALQVSGGGALLPAAALQELRARLNDAAEHEKSAALKSDVLRMRTALAALTGGAAGGGGAAAMDQS